jgi:hypothetical protein
MDFANSNKEFKRMSEYFAEQMRINLGAKVKRKSYKSKWRNGKPYNTSVKTFRGNHNASGNLIKSIKVVKSNIGYAVKINDYGEFVNDGRNKGKGIPISAINKWIKQKNLKPRDIKTGSFKKNTPAARKSMAFMMNRKIKYFGIEPYPFIKMSRETTVYQFKDTIKNAMKKDIMNNLGVIFKQKR